MFLPSIEIIQNPFLVAFKSHALKKSTEIIENSPSIWPDVFHIFISVILPILIFISVYYFLVKFLNVAQEISASLKKISDSYASKNEKLK